MSVKGKRVFLIPLDPAESKNEWHRIPHLKVVVEVEMNTRHGLNWHLADGVYATLSFSGELWECEGYACTLHAFGQISDRVKALAKKRGLNLPRALDVVLNIWDKYHLNHQTPGTYEQEKALYEHNLCQCTFEQKCYFLKEIGLYTDKGHSYGKRKLIRPIPEKAIAAVQKIFHLSA